MEQLWVAYLIDEQGHVAYAYRHPTDAEVLAYAATLDGAEPLLVCVEHRSLGGRHSRMFCDWSDEYEENPGVACRMVKGRWFPLPDKETDRWLT